MQDRRSSFVTVALLVRRCNPKMRYINKYRKKELSVIDGGTKQVPSTALCQTTDRRSCRPRCRVDRYANVRLCVYHTHSVSDQLDPSVPPHSSTLPHFIGTRLVYSLSVSDLQLRSPPYATKRRKKCAIVLTPTKLRIIICTFLDAVFSKR